MVGGEAVIYYGYARLTGDIDFFYESSPDNAQKIYAALNEFWHGDIPGIKKQNEFTQKGMVFQFGVPPNRIDLLNAIDGVKFSDAWKEKETQLYLFKKKKFPVHYIGIDDLIKNKRAVHRNKDKDDLIFLEAVKKKKTGLRI